MAYIGEVLRLGRLHNQLQMQALRQGMNMEEYLEILLDNDKVRDVELSSLVADGVLAELAVKYGVSKPTISKWRSGDVSRCSVMVGDRILALDGVKVPTRT